MSSAEPVATAALAEPDAALAEFLSGIGVAVRDDDGACAILAAPLGEDCTAVATRTGADHKRLVAIDLSVETTSRVTVMSAPGADLALRDQVIAAIAADGRTLTAMADAAGSLPNASARWSPTSDAKSRSSALLRPTISTPQ